MWGGERRSVSISTGKERLMSEENRKAIRISVRNLVEFVLRSGDIDNRRSGNAQKDAMLAGGRDPQEDPEADGIRLPGGGPLKA